MPIKFKCWKNRENCVSFLPDTDSLMFSICWKLTFVPNENEEPTVAPGSILRRRTCICKLPGVRHVEKFQTLRI